MNEFPEINGKFGEVVGNVMAEGNRLDEEFRDQLKATSDRRQNITDQIIGGLMGKKSQMTPELQAIVNALQSQPRLIPAVARFLQDKIKKIDEALDDILGVDEKPVT